MIDSLFDRELVVIQSFSSTNIELITDSLYHAILGAFPLPSGHDIAESNVELLSLLLITAVFRLCKTSLHEHDYLCVCLYLALRCYGCQCLGDALCQVELTNESYNDFARKSTISKTLVRNPSQQPQARMLPVTI
jgi:hypothetical protein